jgi:hypothetical protein
MPRKWTLFEETGLLGLGRPGRKESEVGIACNRTGYFGTEVYNAAAALLRLTAVKSEFHYSKSINELASDFINTILITNTFTYVIASNSEEVYLLFLCKSLHGTALIRFYLGSTEYWMLYGC